MLFKINAGYAANSISAGNIRKYWTISCELLPKYFAYISSSYTENHFNDVKVLSYVQYAK